VAGSAFASAAADRPAIDEAIRHANEAYLRGDIRETASILESAVALAAQRREPVASYAGAVGRLGKLYVMLGRYAAAESALTQTVAAAEKTLGSQHPDVARELIGLAGLYQAQGRYAEAEAGFQRALRILALAYGMDHPLVADCIYALADLSRLQKRYEEAERGYWRAYMIQVYLYGKGSSSVGQTLFGLGQTCLAQNRREEAESLFRRALEIAETPPRTDGTWGRLDERDLRELLAGERDHPAVKGYIFSRVTGSTHPEYALHFDKLGNLYLALNKYSVSETYYQRSIAMLEKAFDAEHPKLQEDLGKIALLRKLQGDEAGALGAARRAADIFNRRILGLSRGEPAQAQGERVRSQAIFLLLLSLPHASIDEVFAAVQNANLSSPAHAGAAPMALAEVQRLLGADEVLVASAGGGDALYAVVVRKHSAAVRRLKPGPVLDGLEDELSGSRHILWVPDNSARTIATRVRITTLPSVSALDRPQGRF
jgi:tetratricopeptide (TPR) repeat protein